jgi:signal peptide peptidase SppA
MNLELIAYLTDPHRLWALDEASLMAYKAAAEAHDGAVLVARVPARGSVSSGNVAVIDVSGPISPRPSVFSELFGGTAISSLQASFRQALADETVKAIVFAFDTPGGEVGAVGDFAAEILAARGQKPILAQITGMAASAGYWLASAADQIVSTRSGLAGSIGVVAAHADVSGAMAQEGVKVTLITAGRYKAEGSPYAPLDDEARAHVQTLVDAAYDDFVGDVARGRGVTVSAVQKGYGQGRIYQGKAAKAAGLIDRIDTLEGTLARLAGRSRAGAMRAEDNAPALQAAANPITPEPIIAPAEDDTRARRLRVL